MPKPHRQRRAKVPSVHEADLLARQAAYHPPLFPQPPSPVQAAFLMPKHKGDTHG